MSEIHIPQGLYYTQEHEWVRLDGDLAEVGLTDYAQDQLGDITYVDLPQVGTQVEQMEELCVVESVKAASDVYSPLAGVVAEVNSALEEHPELINSDPYGQGWLVRLRDFDRAGLDKLMDAQAYRDLISKE